MFSYSLSSFLLRVVERVRLVKPDNARAVEEHVIRLARTGKLQDKVNEDTLIKMLEDVSNLEAKGAVKKVKIVRKKHADSESEEEEDF